jgi:hypothetical protein
MVPQTTKATIDLLRVSIDWDSLTKTFQDAILLTRILGMDYIWIDSFCIIQDDKSDWLREIPKMAGIYENAELVVSAAASKDGTGGIFWDRKPVQILASIDRPDSWTAREHASLHRVIRDPGNGDGPVEYIVRDTARHAQWTRLG